MRRQVFLNSDENYLVPLTVMLYSLLKTARTDAELTVYIATTPKFFELGYDGRIRELVSRYPFAGVVFIDAMATLAKFSGIIDSERNVWSPVMWCGSLITEVLPPEVTGTVVYLDVDMMVRHDLEPLYSLDLADGGYLMAAVNEVKHSYFPELQKRGWGAECGDYFNYGVMVIDIDAWRREDVAAKMLDWYAKNPDTFLLNQDTANVVCGTRTLRLPPKWNYFDAWLQRSIRMNPFAHRWRVYPKVDFLEAIVDPCIVHFVGREKPWCFTRRPMRKEYHALMRELGLYDRRVEGVTAWERFRIRFFNVYHGLLMKYVRFLRRRCDSGTAAGGRWFVAAGCVVLVGFFVLVRWALDQPLDQNVKSAARPSEREVASGMSIRYRHLHAESVSFRSCRIKRRRMGAFVLGAFRVLELEDVCLNLPFPAEMGEASPSTGKPDGGAKEPSVSAQSGRQLDKVMEKIGLSGLGRFSGVTIHGLRVGRMTETGAEPLFTAKRAETRGTSLTLFQCEVYRNGVIESVPKAGLERDGGLRLVWSDGSLDLPDLLEVKR